MTERNETIGETLSGRQERLLAKLHDGECGVIEKFLAERLLVRSAAAQRYTESLRTAAESLRGRAAAAARPDLWMNISARIAQEKRAEVFLGRRRETVLERFGAFLREHRHVAWGVPSGAALAGVILLFVAPNPAPVTSGVAPIASVSAPSGFSAAAVSAPTVNLASAGSPRSFRTPVEVDWVRGNGRVRVMQDPQRSSAIIWVRRPQSPSFLPGERFVAPTPLGGAGLAPTFGGPGR